MQGRFWVWGLLVAAVVLVVVGGAVLLFAPASIGWFAYSPLSSTTPFEFTGGVYPITAERAGGVAAVAAGLLLIAGVAGWVLGRRSALRGLTRSGALRAEE